MREHKYRVYSPSCKTWWYCDLRELFMALGTTGIERSKFYGPIDDDGFIIEQFTGLKDKKGKDIYEGDIVEIVYNNNNDDVTAVVKFIKSDAFYTMESVKNPGQLYSINFRGSVVDGVYIIGNIHEDGGLHG